MQPAYLVVSSFGFLVWDIAQNHGAWTRASFATFAHGMHLFGLS